MVNRGVWLTPMGPRWWQVSSASINIWRLSLLEGHIEQKKSLVDFSRGEKYVNKNKFLKEELNSRSSSFLQSIVEWSWRHFNGRRMADGHGQHQHVHLRDFARFHTHGAHDAQENEGNYRIQGRRFDPGTRYGQTFSPQRQNDDEIHEFERAGGTISNLYAVLAARHRKYPRVKSEGLQSLPGPLVMFTSEHVKKFNLNQFYHHEFIGDFVCM